jgi:hypothetical protein
MVVKPDMSANITVAILRSDSMEVLFSPTDYSSFEKKVLSGCTWGTSKVDKLYYNP